MGIDERGPGMGESTTDDTRSGVTRREAIKKGAIVGGTVLWVAPLVQSVGMGSASAQTPSPGGGQCVCTGTNSFDAKVTLDGLIDGTVGPIQEFPEDNDCLANLALVATGSINAVVTADLDCVGGSTTGATCSSFVELTNLGVDLRTINPLLNVQLDASVVRAEAECTCGGGCETSSCITQADGEAIVTIGGTVVLASAGLEICGRLEFAVNLGDVTGTVVLNDTDDDPCQATVATIDVFIPGVLGLEGQRVNIVIARATAVCTQG